MRLSWSTTACRSLSVITHVAPTMRAAIRRKVTIVFKTSPPKIRHVYKGAEKYRVAEAMIPDDSAASETRLFRMVIPSRGCYGGRETGDEIGGFHLTERSFAARSAGICYRSL